MQPTLSAAFVRFLFIFCESGYFAVTVAAVLEVLTSGVIQKTGASVVLFTMMLAEVGSLVPCFTVMLPVPRLGAVRSERLLFTFFSKR